MRKRVALALLLAAALIVSTGCSLIVKDEEVDNQTVIVEAAGKTYTKGEINTLVQNNLDYQEYVYSMYYGMSFDKTSASAVSSARDSVIDSLVESAVEEAKIAELGIVLTDEEIAEAQEEAESNYQLYADMVKSSYFADTELSDEELETELATKMSELGYASLEELAESSRESKLLEKLREETVKDASVSDEEVREEYDARVETAKANYETSPSSYGTDVSNGSEIYYTPAGYRFVKHILRQFTDEDSEKLADLENQISDKQTQLNNVESSLEEMGEAVEGEDEQTATSRKELSDTQATLTAELADLNQQLEAAREAAYAALQPTIEEIQGKLAAGEDFDALMEEYGEDSGMKSDPAKTTGYPVCADSTNWVTEFRDAAMALTAVGDVSEPVRSEYGVHIIKYVGDATEGPADYESVKESIHSSLLGTVRNELYSSRLSQWVQEADAKIHKDLLD